MSKSNYSLLYPNGKEGFKRLSDITIHDLGLDSICKSLSAKEGEQNLILNVLMQVTSNPDITSYRCDIFDDIYKNKPMRDNLMEILDRINFLKDYGSFKRDFEEAASTWELLHRLDEINDYIKCIEAIHHCLSNVNLISKGLIDLRTYVDSLYHENGFDALKKDIMELKATTSSLRSVTVGINLNDRFEANGIGLISINNKYFTKSTILSNFCDLVSSKDKLNDTTNWNDTYKFHPFTTNGMNLLDTMEHAGKMNMAVSNPIAMAGIVGVPDGDSTQDITRYMDRIVNHMLSSMVKRLRTMLNQYVSITITNITDLIPEFIYYIRWAEYIEGLQSEGATFCKATISMDDLSERTMDGKGIYNLKLASLRTTSEDIITNDLIFDKEHRVYLLTGANRGGKTTITQAIGQLFILAQGGVNVPGESFSFHPVDSVYTHFPADEDKTMDLGRLGEECKRFRELYKDCTKNSLLLLNETFSTTSFEEGYYIAKDSVKAILHKGIRTIYNTHMHKLAYDIPSMNEGITDGKAQSLIVRSDGGKRSYKVELAEPIGQSYANDIALKYGVTYELLTN